MDEIDFEPHELYSLQSAANTVMAAGRHIDILPLIILIMRDVIFAETGIALRHRRSKIACPA